MAQERRTSAMPPDSVQPDRAHHGRPDIATTTKADTGNPNSRPRLRRHERPAQAVPGGYLVPLIVRATDGETVPRDCRFWSNTGRAELGA
jgi:hypothetical protein